MHWSWRANPLPVVLDALLEGSLVGVPYLALVLAGPGSTAPLSLVEFWLAAGAGLLASRWRPRHLTGVNWDRALALLCGVAGWLADSAARDVLVTMHDPLAALQIHPAGWLLGVAVLLGAIHQKPELESQVAPRAVTLAFPVLAVSLLLHAGSSDAFGASGFIGSVVCIAAGLLAIGQARMRELDALGSVTRGGQTWPALATAVVVVAMLAIPIALLATTSGRDSAVSILGPVADGGKAVAGATGSAVNWLGGVLFGWLPNTSMAPVPTSMPTSMPSSTPIPPSAGSSMSLPSIPGLDVFARIGLAILVILLLIRFRRVIPGRPTAPPPSQLSEERYRDPRRLRLSLHLPRPTFLPHIALRRSRPTTAAAAYLALLDDLAHRGDLARSPAETPRDHVRRTAALGLPHLPLGLLAADYELAVYGQVDITSRETRRALGRWKRLRKLARRLPSASAEDQDGGQPLSDATRSWGSATR
jgi:hypothetical protein